LFDMNNSKQKQLKNLKTQVWSRGYGEKNVDFVYVPDAPRLRLMSASVHIQAQQGPVSPFLILVRGGKH